MPLGPIKDGLLLFHNSSPKVIRPLSPDYTATWNPLKVHQSHGLSDDPGQLRGGQVAIRDGARAFADCCLWTKPRRQLWVCCSPWRGWLTLNTRQQPESCAKMVDLSRHASSKSMDKGTLSFSQGGIKILLLEQKSRPWVSAEMMQFKLYFHQNHR